jgi:hypothetical protein
MTAHSIQTQPSRRVAPKAAALALGFIIAAAAAFAVAYLLSHGSTPAAPPVKVVNATIKPGPDTATLKKAFATTVRPLAKPPVVHKPKAKPKPKPTAPAPSTDSSSASPYTPPAASTDTPPATSTYTPPAASTDTPPASSTDTPPAAPKKTAPAKSSPKKQAPEGGGVITIG